MDLKPTHVNVKLDAEFNELLTKSALKNERSKRKEAQARLKDHLNRFEDMGMGIIGTDKS